MVTYFISSIIFFVFFEESNSIDRFEMNPVPVLYDGYISERCSLEETLMFFCKI